LLRTGSCSSVAAGRRGRQARRAGTGIVTVDDDAVLRTSRLARERAKPLIEPGSAVPAPAR
jgi:threonine synthase